MFIPLDTCMTLDIGHWTLFCLQVDISLVLKCDVLLIFATLEGIVIVVNKDKDKLIPRAGKW